LVFQWLRFDGVGVTCAAVSLALAGCAGTTVGGRPLIYKQGKADAPSTIGTHAGVVVKRESAQPAAGAAEPTPAPAASSPAVVAAPAERAVAQAAPAQAAPVAPPSASSRETVVSGDALSRYTQATRYGDLLFVSGQIALDPVSGGFDLTQDIQAQTRRVMQNILSILESNRLTMANVVYATVYLSSLAHFAGMNPVYHSIFKSEPPARSVTEVGRLPRGALVQIAVVAGR
jgi:2-iminobutanoate/2-iminopropanoate deaminase